MSTRAHRRADAASQRRHTAPRRTPTSSPSPASLRRPARATPALTPLDLYELCTQDPPTIVALLRAVHGRQPRVLHEDFCGTAAVSRAWVRTLPRTRALAVDHDPRVLDAARARLGPRLARRVWLVHHDLLSPLRSPPTPRLRSPGTSSRQRRWRADAIYVGNFSIAEIHDPAALTAYLRRCRDRLAPSGILVCDLYAGPSAFRAATTRRDFPAARGIIVRYEWEQRRADPRSRLVENHIHFSLRSGRRTVARFPSAFVYRWRLWSVPRLRAAMRRAGFRRTEVLDARPGAIDHRGRAYPRAPGPRSADATLWVVARR